MSDSRRIPKKIWDDPEFTKMTMGAQLLWFVLVASPAGKRNYRREVAQQYANFTKAQIKRAEKELRANPKYCTAFTGWKFRPSIPKALRSAVYERDGHTCLHCGATDSLTLDHILPYSLGGPDSLDNLQTLCRSCNSRKGARV